MEHLLTQQGKLVPPWWNDSYLWLWKIWDTIVRQNAQFILFFTIASEIPSWRFPMVNN